METEWIMVADHAEILNNKAYVMSGGWNVVVVNQPLPFQHRMAIVAAYSIPWNQTNEVHDVFIEIVDQDARSLAQVEGQLEVGRPPGITPGQEQRQLFSLNLNLTLDKLGPYVVTSRAGGKDKSVKFTVLAGPGMPRQDASALGATP